MPAYEYSATMATKTEIPEGLESQAAQARLGDVLRRARQHRGYSLRQVEQRTGVLNAHLSQIERGQIRRPDAALLWRLSELYALNYDLLAHWAGHTTEPDGNAAELAAAIRLLGDLDAEAVAEVLRVIDRLHRDRAHAR